MTTNRSAAGQGRDSITSTNLPDVDQQLEEAIREIDVIWNMMLLIRRSIAINPNNRRQEFAMLCRNMEDHIYELGQRPEWRDITSELKKSWDTLQTHHRRIDWDAMDGLKHASQEFEDCLSCLPWLLEQLAEERFPASLPRWPVTQTSDANRMEALEAENQRLTAILENLGGRGAGDGVGYGPHCG